MPDYTDAQTAWDQLLGQLEEGETIEAVVFGFRAEPGDEPELVPEDLIGQILTAEEAAPHMTEWRIGNLLEGDTETPQPFTIWTDRRIFSITTTMDGFWLSWLPRHPVAVSACYAGSLAW